MWRLVGSYIIESTGIYVWRRRGGGTSRRDAGTHPSPRIIFFMCWLVPMVMAALVHSSIARAIGCCAAANKGKRCRNASKGVCAHLIPREKPKSQPKEGDMCARQSVGTGRRAFRSFGITHTYRYTVYPRCLGLPGRRYHSSIFKTPCR